MFLFWTFQRLSQMNFEATFQNIFTCFTFNEKSLFHLLDICWPQYFPLLSYSSMVLCLGRLHQQRLGCGFHLTHFFCDDCESKCTPSYHHHLWFLLGYLPSQAPVRWSTWWFLWYYAGQSVNQLCSRWFQTPWRSYDVAVRIFIPFHLFTHQLWTARSSRR